MARVAHNACPACTFDPLQCPFLSAVFLPRGPPAWRFRHGYRLGWTLFFSRRCLSQRRGLPRVALLESLESRRQLDVGEPAYALPDADVSRDTGFWPAQWRAPTSVAASFRGPAGDVLDGAPPRPYPSRRRARGVDLHAFHLVQPA